MLIIQQQNIHPNTFPSVNPVKQKHCYYVVTAFFCTAFLTNDIHITKTDFSSCPVYESGCRDCELQSIAGECFSTQGKFLLSCFLHLFIIQLTYTSLFLQYLLCRTFKEQWAWPWDWKLGIQQRIAGNYGWLDLILWAKARSDLISRSIFPKQNQICSKEV